jgi:hypothetical protein
MGVIVAQYCDGLNPSELHMRIAVMTGINDNDNDVDGNSMKQNAIKK